MKKIFIFVRCFQNYSFADKAAKQRNVIQLGEEKTFIFKPLFKKVGSLY